MQFHRRFATGVLVALLSACASLPEGGGRGDVEALVREHGRDVSSAGDARVAETFLASLAGRPITAADAVRLALVNNPRLKASYAQLGFAAADVYDAGRLANPTLSASMLFPDTAGASAQIGLGLAQNFTNLLLLSRRSHLAQAEFARVQQAVAAEILDLAAEAETTYYEAVGAAQISTLRDRVANAATVSAQLAESFFDAGNITRLQLSQEQAAAAQATLDSLEAGAAVTDQRTRLSAVMGLTDRDQRWQLAPRLAAPLAKEDDWATVVQLADARPDLKAARDNVRLLSDALGVTRSFRYLGDVELGIETERETDGSRITGPTLGLELPIFNQGEGRSARAAAALERADAQLKALEIDISNSLRRAHAQVASAKGRVEHYRTALVPLREAVVARTQEQVNFMLVGQFELLLAKQQEYQAYEGYLKAVRDYWVARTELAHAAGAQLPSGSQAVGEVLDAQELTRPKTSGMQMNHEDMPMDGSGEGMEGMGHDMQQMDKSGDDMKGMEHEMPGADKPGGNMKGMQHDMPGMDKAGGAKTKEAAPKKDAPPSMPPPRKGEGKSEMPTGMEGHIPESADSKPADKSDPAQEKPVESDAHQHGDHP